MNGMFCSAGGVRIYITKVAVIAVLISAFFQLATAKEAPDNGLRSVDRAVVFAIQQEFQRIGPESLKNVCVGFGHGLDIHDKAVISELKNKGLKVHRADWCNRGPRRVQIAIVAPIRETSPGTYEFVLEVGDLFIPEGEHFATLLRRGTYIVHYEGASEAQLVSYHQTCCP